MRNHGLRATTSFRWLSGSDIPLSWHLARLLASASALDWQQAVAMLSHVTALTELEKNVEDHISSSSIDRAREYKMNIHVSSHGDMTISSSELTGPLYDFHLIQSQPDDQAGVVDVYISPAATPTSIYTKHKTSLRQHYDDARMAVSILKLPPTTAEVLLWNEQEEITEASLCTVYFRQGDSWITPRAESGCNLGLSRALALERGWCREGVVLRSELRHGEIIKLSNCVRGFWSGRITLHH